MKVSHTLLNSVNPIRLSRNEFDVSNHLIRIITLTRGIVLMNPLPWACLILFYSYSDEYDIEKPCGWWIQRDLNPQLHPCKGCTLPIASWTHRLSFASPQFIFEWSIAASHIPQAFPPASVVVERLNPCVRPLYGHFKWLPNHYYLSILLLPLPFKFISSFSFTVCTLSNMHSNPTNLNRGGIMIIN